MRSKIWRAVTAALVAMAVTAGLAVGIPPTPAQATTLPPLKYPATSLAGLPSPAHTISSPDGGTVVGGCGGNGGNTTGFTQFGPTGTALQSKPLVVDGRTLYFCENQSAVGKDGAVYTAAYEPAASKMQLVSFKAGTQKWVYANPCSSISSVAMGSNGNVYAVVQGGSCPWPRLVGLKPNLAAGQTKPTEAANTEVQRNVLGGGLAVYSSGIVLRHGDGLSFYTYAGAKKNNPASSSLPLGGFDGGPFTTVDGRAIVPVKCADGSGVATVEAYSVTNRVWSHTLNDCPQLLGLRPLYNGGAVALLQTSAGYTLYGVTSGGTKAWSSDFPASGTQGLSSFTFTTDTNGNVVVERQFSKRDDSDGWDYPGVVVGVFSGFTGQPQGGFQATGDHTDDYGFCIPGGSDNTPTIASGLAFLTLAHGKGSGCNNTTTALYAMQVPGLGLDYPRGATYSVVAWRSYAALGDSFSSGLSLSPYIAPSDKDGCARSYQAYSELLDANPQLRLKLQPYPIVGVLKNPPASTFVACAGAETKDILGTGQNGEPSQLNTLTKSTKIVTITISGNDVGFVPLARACVTDVKQDCTTSVELHDTLYKIQHTLPSALDKTYKAIKGKLGASAKVLVIGYPMIVPEATAPTTPGSCLYLSGGEKDALRSVIAKLDSVIQAATKRAGSQFYYIDPNGGNSPFKGHEICNPGNYFNGAILPPRDGESFHPNIEGGDAYRRLIVGYIAGNNI